MRPASYYDVYTKDEEMIYSNVTAREISNELGIKMSVVSNYANYGKLYKGIYKFVKVEEGITKMESQIPEEFWHEWENVRTMFHKVTWVQKYEPGVIRLRTEKVG